MTLKQEAIALVVVIGLILLIRASWLGIGSAKATIRRWEATGGNGVKLIVRVLRLRVTLLRKHVASRNDLASMTYALLHSNHA